MVEWYLINLPMITHFNASLIGSTHVDPWFLASSAYPHLHLYTSADSSIQETLTLPNAHRPSHESHLLALPPELRNKIYSAALLDTIPNIALLQACRQINMEAQSTLYQRHISFSSQETFLQWIERSHSSNLRDVKRLTLQITDIDLSPLFDRDRGCRNAWSLYQRELQQLDQALASLPNVSDLTITPPTSSCSQLVRGMYLSFLTLISQRYPKLENLILNDHEDILQKVPALGRLPKVTFAANAVPKKSKYTPSGAFDLAFRSKHSKQLSSPANKHEPSRRPIKLERS
ncbi:Hypothetical protein R9X50_00485700 [Acrodontium crateriforme]|uniref:Uncharacterized protein n=1 Tax=Acrodontium crateriforme TaxID=150365 RepID=A0AAQ3M8C9_9PEZI|nr:Hypothetical protein R9X50_00485700 [Acrodontium crateriforme]